MTKPKPTRQDVFEYNGTAYDTMKDMIQAMVEVAKATGVNQVGTDTVTIVVAAVDPPPPPPGDDIGAPDPTDPLFVLPADA